METKAKIRLLRCDDCKTLEELPDFDGPPEHDVLLEMVLSRHETNGHRHVGRLIDVEERAWNLKPLRDTIITQIWGGSKGLAEFDPSYYDTQNTFKADALQCYNLHLRPKDGCHDYRADAYRLLPPTKKDRKEIGLDMSGAPKHWLCSFCPVQAYYDKKRRGD